MNSTKVNPDFWSGKKVFITGHTGFKGGWLSIWLHSMGVELFGYSLEPRTSPNFFDVGQIKSLYKKSYISDICDLKLLKNAIEECQPDILIHMAAQPLVRYSYINPVDTYATNVMGTVNALESVRHVNSIKSVVIVTTDKCYENREWEWGYRENEPMGGFDPYSNSKGCAELVTSAFRSSYFSIAGSASVASARAGNVIGGGDWSEDRLIPDAIRAFEGSNTLMIRNPLATRPWQHVLEPLSGYLILAEKLFNNNNFAGAWNFGPNDTDARSVAEVIDLLIKQWGTGAKWLKEGAEQPHEAHLLKLDCSKARQHLSWVPKWNLEMAVEKIVSWQRAFVAKQNMQLFSLSQINQYMES